MTSLLSSLSSRSASATFNNSGARVERLVLDSHARTIALATLPAGPGAARGVVVMILEPGGGVTVAEGLSRPTRHMVNALPLRLQGARAVIDALRGETVRLFWAASTDAAGGADAPPRRAWAATLAHALLTPSGPLDWSDDANEIAIAWARRWISGSDPLVPDLKGSILPHASSKIAAYLSPPTPATATAIFAHTTAAPAPLLPAALYWSPHWCVLNVDAAASEAVGFAWLTTSSKTLTSPILSLWPFACDAMGIVSWTRLPDDYDDNDHDHGVSDDSSRGDNVNSNLNSGPRNALLEALRVAGASSDIATSLAKEISQHKSIPSIKNAASGTVKRLEIRDPRCERTRALLRSAGWLRGGIEDDDEGGPGAGGFRGLIAPIPDDAHRSLPFTSVPALHARGALRAGARVAAELIDLGPCAAAGATSSDAAAALREAAFSTTTALHDSNDDGGNSGGGDGGGSGGGGRFITDRPLAWASWADATRDESRADTTSATITREEKDAEYNYRAVRQAAARALAATDALTRRLRGQGL